MLPSDQKYCPSCHAVWTGNSYSCWRCKQDAVLFSPAEHGESLIGSSNSWISVYEKWKNNPIFRQVAQELAEDGSYGAATCMNVFIEELLHYYGEG